MEWFRFLEYRISMVFLLSFLLSFQPLKRSYSRSFGMAAVCFVVTGVLEWVEIFYFSFDNVVLPMTLIEILLVQGLAWELCKYRDGRAVFTGVSSSVFVLPGNVMCLLTYLTSENVIISLLVQTLIHAGLLLIFRTAIREDYLEEMAVERKGWGVLCLIPALFYAAIATLTTWPQNIYEAPDSMLGIICIMLLMPVTYFILIKMFANQHQEATLNRNIRYLENYTQRLKHEREMLMESEYQVAVLRHDMRHVAALISTYLEAGNQEKIYQVLHELDEKLEITHPKGYCDNVAINGIIAEGAALAEKHHVDFQVEVAIAENLPFNEYEYVTVLSNLLDNAVMAAAGVTSLGKRFVRLAMKKVKDQQLLEINNSYEGEIEFSRKTGLPLSAKGNGHGYGMGSVQAYAQKYGAIFDCTAQEGVFTVRFLVNLKEREA